jgi:hypothetical protein
MKPKWRVATHVIFFRDFPNRQFAVVLERLDRPIEHSGDTSCIFAGQLSLRAFARFFAC